MGDERDLDGAGSVGRRQILLGGVVLAGAATGVVASGEPAGADNGQPMVLGADNSATIPTSVSTQSATTLVARTNAAQIPGGEASPPAAVYARGVSSFGLFARSDAAPGAIGFSTGNYGVIGHSLVSSGVWGLTGTQFPIDPNEPNLGAGVFGLADDRFGVSGLSIEGTGVVGQRGLTVHIDPNNPALGAGVFGLADDAPGVVGQHGIVPLDPNDPALGAGVFGLADDGIGVSALSRSGAGFHVTVPTTGTGLCVDVVGAGHVELSNDATTGATDVLNASTANNGTAVDAFSKKGIGVQARGGLAPLRLFPRSVTGPPTTRPHAVGEVVVDNLGQLWACTDDGTPGTWRRVAFADEIP
jgi:hypothetical protein